jgi:hypothetical protein
MDSQINLNKDYLLSCSPLLREDGLYQARVAITYLGGERTRSQRFLDLDSFPTKEQAVAAAQAAGIEWVNREASR